MSVQTEIDRIITAVESAHEAVAEKGGTTARPYLVGNLASAIASIPESEAPVLQSKTVTPTTSQQSVTPDSGYDGLSKVTVNAMPAATQATPSISVSSGGLITASATQSAGYVASGTKSATKQLTVQAAQTITPGTTDKTIASGRYLTGAQTISGDANLIADNIKSGTSIFGVTGTYEGSGGGGGGGGTVLDAQVTFTYTNTASGMMTPYKILVFKNSSTMDYESNAATRYLNRPSGTMVLPLSGYAVTDSVIVIYLGAAAVFESATGSEGVDIISCNDRVLALHVKPEATADTLTCSASVVSA